MVLKELYGVKEILLKEGDKRNLKLRNKKLEIQESCVKNQD